MPAAGVYKKEIDLSLFIEISSDLVLGAVHTFSKGPVNERTLITNSGALETTFGRPIDDDIHGQGFFGLREFLRNANQAYVMRVESNVNPALTPKTSLVGGTDDFLVTGADGDVAAPGNVFDSSGSLFQTAGLVSGDVLQIESGTLNLGFYVIDAVTSETQLTLIKTLVVEATLDFTVWTSKAGEAADGATGSQYSRLFTSSGSTFITDSIKSGDVLHINDTSDPGDNGFYVVQNVTGETTLTVNRDWFEGENTVLEFTIYKDNHPDMEDGSTATDGEFLSSLAQFELHNVKAGDLLLIEDDVDLDNNGTYVITGLKTGVESTTLEVNTRAWTTSNTNLKYRVLPCPITFEGESPGTWGNGFTISSGVNAVDPLLTDISLFDTSGALLETVGGVDQTNIVEEYVANSSYLVPTVVTGRLGPAISSTGTMNGGDNGTTGITDADYIGLGTNGLQSFKSVEEITIDLLMIPGQSSQNIGDALLNMAEVTRGDCMAIVDPPDWPTVSSVTDAINWHNGQGGLGRTTSLNSSHAALFWTWQLIYDPFNDKDRWTAPSGHASSVWAQSQNATYPWFAPAGLRRGKVKGSKGLRHSPDSGEQAALQASGQSVNPIVQFIKEGIHVWGQKTLFRAPTALNRINVRRMLLFIERAVLNASKYLVFEPGDEATDREFIRLVTPLLEYVRDNRGLREFLVVAASTDFIREQNKALFKIFTKPTKAAEIIEIQFVLTSQTASFEELLAA